MPILFFVVKDYLTAEKSPICVRASKIKDFYWVLSGLGNIRQSAIEVKLRSIVITVLQYGYFDLTRLSIFFLRSLSSMPMP